MTQSELISGMIQRSAEMLKGHLADFSDADMMVRPVPGANHAAWQVAHIANYAVTVARLLSPDATLPVPAKLAGCQGPEASKSDDASRFPSKAELLAVLEAAAKVQAAAVAKMSEADFSKPAPERFERIAKNLGQLLMMGPFHNSMHSGQIQVIRRKLGKPMLF